MRGEWQVVDAGSWINLSGTPVTSLTPLIGLDALRSLTINGAQLRELGAQGAFAKLQFFSARGAPIGSLSALAPAYGLEAIDISDTPVSDLTPLRAACNCRTLLLRGSKVDDLTPLIDTGSREEDHRYSRKSLTFAIRLLRVPASGSPNLPLLATRTSTNASWRRSASSQRSWANTKLRRALSLALIEFNMLW